VSPARLAFPSTHVSLLEAVTASHREAWQAFFHRYAPVIRRWCRRHSLPPHATDDVSQTLMADMPRKLRTYSRAKADGGSNRFRAWLRAVVRHEVVNHVRGAAQSCEPLPTNLAAVDELEDDLTAIHRADVRAVVEAVRRKIQPDTWTIYEEVHLAGRAAQDVADQHGKSVGAVFVAVNRVNRMLRDEYQALLKSRPDFDEVSPDVIVTVSAADRPSALSRRRVD
jgi:RNA polymerase sigma factor (sigma-70 family)